MDSDVILHELDACLTRAMQQGVSDEGIAFTLDKTQLTDKASVAVCERLERFFEMINEANRGAESLAYGSLDLVASRDNVFAMPYKALSACLRHLTWQAAQVAAGDLRHEVHFLGEFSDAFNRMVGILREKNVLEQRLKAMMDALEEGVLLFDEPGTLLFMNLKAEHLLGSESDNLTGTRIDDLIRIGHSGTGEQKAVSPLAAAVTSGREFHSDEALLLSRSGSGIPVVLTCSPMDKNDAGCAAVITFQEVTAKPDSQASQGPLPLPVAVEESKTPSLTALEGDLRPAALGILAMSEICLATKLTAEQEAYLTALKASAKHLVWVLEKTVPAEAAACAVAVEDGNPYAKRYN